MPRSKKNPWIDVILNTVQSSLRRVRRGLHGKEQPMEDPFKEYPINQKLSGEDSLTELPALGERLCFLLCRQ